MPMPAAHDTSPMPASDLTVLRSNPFCTLNTMFAGSESGEASPGSTDEAEADALSSRVRPNAVRYQRIDVIRHAAKPPAQSAACKQTSPLARSDWDT